MAVTHNEEKIHIPRNKDLFEIVQFEDKAFPIRVELHRLSNYFLNSFDCHWHNEFEFLFVKKGSMRCFVDDNEIMIKEEQCILINSNHFHYASGIGDKDCEYIVILMAPDFIGGKESRIYERYVAPLVADKRIPYIMPEGESRLNTFEIAEKMLDIYNDKKFGYELLMGMEVNRLWREIIKNIPEDLEECSSDIRYVKKMLFFIHNNYADEFTVKDIAENVNLSYGEACRIFKRSTNQTIINYLQAYRIKKSLTCLMSGDMNISEIAAAVGFNGASYYSEVFRKVTGMSPVEYKKAELERRKRVNNEV